MDLKQVVLNLRVERNLKGKYPVVVKIPSNIGSININKVTAKGPENKPNASEENLSPEEPNHTKGNAKQSMQGTEIIKLVSIIFSLE